MKKKITKVVALTLVCALLINEVPTQDIYAEKNDVSVEKEEYVIDATGKEDINEDIYSTDESLLIADGYEAIIDVPKDLSESITIDDGLGEVLKYDLPEAENDLNGTLVNDTVLYTDEESSVSYGIQALQIEGKNEQTLEGVRTTIVIDNSFAPKSYEFTYDLREDQRMVSATEFLGDDYDTQEVFILNKNNEVEYIIDAPWAKDANGDSVPTHYEINGNKLVQIVEFDENSAFPIVADPSIWQIAKCVAAVAWVVGSAIFAASKITKIKQYIKELGGMREAVCLMIGATSISDKASKIGETVVKLAEVLLGVDTIINNCPGIKSIYNKLKK